MSSVRVRGWTVTIFVLHSDKNGEIKTWDFPDFLPPGVNFIVGQLEESPETGGMCSILYLLFYLVICFFVKKCCAFLCFFFEKKAFAADFKFF